MIVRSLSLLLCLCLCLYAIAQNKEDMMGNTAAQILAMGHDKWFKLYTGKNGESTAGMTTANDVYAQCLAKDTNARIAKLPQSTRVVLQGLRKPMQAFIEAMIQCGYQVTGGGTIWTLFGSSAYVESEEALAKIVKGPNPRLSLSKLETEAKGKLAKARKTVESSKKDIESFQEGGYKAAIKALDDGGRIFAQIISMSKKIKPDQASTLLKFCSSMANNACDPFGN